MEGLFVSLYLWVYEYFFSGIDSLPVVIQGIAPELCTLVTLLGVVLVLALPLWLLYKFGTIVFNFGRF